MWDWSDEMAERIRKQMEDAVVSDAEEIEIQNRVKKDGLAVREALKSDIFYQGRAVSARLGQEAITAEKSSDGYELVLQRGIRPVAVNFYPQTATSTSTKTTSDSGAFQPRIGNVGRWPFSEEAERLVPEKLHGQSCNP